MGYEYRNTPEAIVRQQAARLVTQAARIAQLEKELADANTGNEKLAGDIQEVKRRLRLTQMAKVKADKRAETSRPVIKELRADLRDAHRQTADAKEETAAVYNRLHQALTTIRVEQKEKNRLHAQVEADARLRAAANEAYARKDK